MLLDSRDRCAAAFSQRLSEGFRMWHTAADDAPRRRVHKPGRVSVSRRFVWPLRTDYWRVCPYHLAHVYEEVASTGRQFCPLCRRGMSVYRHAVADSDGRVVFHPDPHYLQSVTDAP